MIDVGLQKHIQVNWKLFSLKLINGGRAVKEDFKILHEIGLKALRVAAAVRCEFGNAGAGKIYTAMGASYHHDQEDIDEPSVIEEILQTLFTFLDFPFDTAAEIDLPRQSRIGLPGRVGSFLFPSERDVDAGH